MRAKYESNFITDDNIDPLLGNVKKTKDVLKSITTDVHLKILWPKQVPAFQQVIQDAVVNGALTLDDVKSLVSGTTVLTPSPATRGRVHTEGFIHYEAYKGRLAILYQGLYLDRPSLFSDIKTYAVVAESGAEWHPILDVNGISYAIPTSEMDVISPVEMVEEFGVTSNTLKFQPGAYVLKKIDKVAVEKRHRGVVMTKLDKVDYDVKIPVGFGVSTGRSTITAERFSVGYAKNDGEVVFPYDKMTCKIPCRKGEVYLFGQDYNGEWYPVDVVSPQRNLRMSILKGTYGTCKGKVSLIYSPHGTLKLSEVGIVATLKALKLNHVGKVTRKDVYSDGAIAWMESVFDGCSFDFEEIFGYTALTLREIREDVSQVLLKEPELHYEVTVEEIIRCNVTLGGDWVEDIKDMLGVDVDGFDDLMSKLITQSKDYMFLEGHLYDESDEIEMTPFVLHKMWFDYLKVPIEKVGENYYFKKVGNKMRAPFIIVNIGGFLYVNENNRVRIHRLDPEPRDRFKNDEEVKGDDESKNVIPGSNCSFTEYRERINKADMRFDKNESVSMPKSRVVDFEYSGPPQYDRVKVRTDYGLVEEIPAVLGPGDWKSKLNEELQKRGLGLVKYEHDVVYTRGVPRFKSFVWFNGNKVMADNFTPSKKATEQEVAGKILKSLKRDLV
jgi:hypothetical protein